MFMQRHGLDHIDTALRCSTSAWIQYGYQAEANLREQRTVQHRELCFPGQS